MYTAGCMCLDVVFTPLSRIHSSNGNRAVYVALGAVVIAHASFKWHVARKVLIIIFKLVNQRYHIWRRGFWIHYGDNNYEFNPDTDSFAAYVEPMNIFFTVNDIKTEKRAAVFLNFIGGQAYELLHSLLIPELPPSLKYEELMELPKEYYEPKLLVIAERFLFHRPYQRDGKLIADYMAELRRLASSRHT